MIRRAVMLALTKKEAQRVYMLALAGATLSALGGNDPRPDRAILDRFEDAMKRKRGTK